VVNVGVNTEKALEYSLDNFPEILWERGPCMNRKRQSIRIENIYICTI
jgi:hypothetical protein